MMTHLQRGMIAVASAAVMLVATAAAADPILPAASYSLQAGGSSPHNSETQFGNTSGSVSGGINGEDGVASGSASAFSQYVSADASGASQGVHGGSLGSGSATETYYFSVIGPENVSVPLLISGEGYMYATGGGNVEAGENINNLTSFSRVCRVGVTTCGAFSYNQSVSITSGTIAYLTLGIDATAQDSSDGGWIDPMITIDPNFAGADHFHLAFSEGISNGTAFRPACRNRRPGL